MRSYSIAGARNQLPALVRDAETGKAVHLTRLGKPVAVLISVADYDRLTRERDTWAALETFRKNHPADDLDVDEAFSKVRDRSPSRGVKW